MNFDWKFFVTLLATVAGLAVPVWLWQFDLNAKSLTVRIVSSVPLQSPSANSIPDLQISIEGEPVDNPVISTLEIANDGAKPIPTSDFESDIELQISEVSKIIRAKVAEVEPEDLKATVSVDGQSVRLKPLLLNPNDKVTLSVLTSGAIPEFSPRARIAGVPSIKFDGHKGIVGKWNEILLNGIASLTGLVLYFYFGATLFSFSRVKIPKVLVIVSMATLVTLSALAARRVYEVAGIPNDLGNLLPTLIGGTAVGLVTFVLAIRGRGRLDSRAG